MKIYVTSYNNGGSAYNAEAEETRKGHYTLFHTFNRPMEATVVISDPDGSIAQKYNADANDVYIGAGKMRILEEVPDPDENVFKGRIMKAIASRPNRGMPTVSLYCEDWLSQLNEQQITYDMRENLDGSGLRLSTLTPDYADTDGNGIAVAGYEQITYAKQDDGGAFTDEPTAAQNETANDVNVLPNVPDVNDAYYYGFDVKVNGLVINLTTKGVWGGSVAWEYWNGAAWADLGETDGTSNYEAGTGWFEVTFTAPGDWATTAVDGDTAYWVRARVDAYISMTTVPKVGQVWGRLFYVYDQTNILTADAHNGMYLVLTDHMAGAKEWTTGPYTSVVTGSGAGIDNEGGDAGDVWVDDSNSHVVWDNDENWTQDYYFRMNLGHNTSSDLYVADSVTACSFKVKLWFSDNGSQASICTAQVYDNNGAAWRNIGGVRCTDNGKGQASGETWYTFNVPDAYLNYVTDSDGRAKLRFTVTGDPANTTYLYVFYAKIKVSCSTTGYSSAITINDGTTRRLTLATDLWDLYDHTVQIWDGVKYCIVQPIYKHIDSAESGTLITGYDDMETLTCAATIEHTSGLSTSQFEDKTALEILQMLARQDKAEFHIEAGTTTVTWNSTYNAGAADETLSDSAVLSWTQTFDYGPTAHKVIVQGMRIGSQQLEGSYTDTTSRDKFNRSTSPRTKVIKNAGLVSEYEVTQLATNEAGKLSNPQKMLSCQIRGNTLLSTHPKQIKIGYEVQVTSTWLNLSSAWYIVDTFQYDSKSNITTLRLHPRVSQTGLQPNESMSMDHAMNNYRHGTSDKYVPEPSTHEVS